MAADGPHTDTANHLPTKTRQYRSSFGGYWADLPGAIGHRTRLGLLLRAARIPRVTWAPIGLTAAVVVIGAPLPAGSPRAAPSVLVPALIP